MIRKTQLKEDDNYTRLKLKNMKIIQQLNHLPTDITANSYRRKAPIVDATLLTNVNSPRGKSRGRKSNIAAQLNTSGYKMHMNPKFQEEQRYEAHLLLQQLCSTHSHNGSSSIFNGALGEK